MRSEVNVLVGVCGFSVDVGGESTVWIALDVDIQHVDEPIFLLLLRPLNVGVDRVDVAEESVCVVLVDGN